MSLFVFNLCDIDKTKIDVTGGKAANLGELTRLNGIQVPGGFCISAEVFKTIIYNNPKVHQLLHQLSLLRAEEWDNIRKLSIEIRKVIEEITIPESISEEIKSNIIKLGENDAYAVRSSATAEDLPTASFAGQQDTYLNITGTENILKHTGKCWASLFTERAIIYRIQNGFNHSQVHIAVIVQQMIFPQAAGILFTADPVTGNRKVLSIDAGFGLGEALVSGLVNADHYKVCKGKITGKKISIKQMAVYAAKKDDGTKKHTVEPDKQNTQVLTDEQILQLAHTGKKIEAHFGCPQDVEWCLADDTFYIVQSRPVTTLFPIPGADDDENHVYVSVGHQQMMTDAMKPLGISVRQLTAGRNMYTAGGRMFVDVAQQLASPAGRNILINVLGKSDPLIRDALLTILERENFIQSSAENNMAESKDTPRVDYETLKDYDAAVVEDLTRQSEAEIESLQQNITTKSGAALIDFILEDIQRLKQSITNPQSFGVIMTGMNALTWLNEKMNEWLGEKNVADTLIQSVPNNITSQMGLALLDVADAIRPYPEVITFLQHAKHSNFLNELLKRQGGKETCEAIRFFLNKYGMRCAGEIDITRTRWSENPATLIPIILNNIKNFKPGESKRKFEKGLKEALNKEQKLLERLKQLPDGEQKAAETKRMINLVRNLAGYREYPKYEIVSRYFIYKQALLKEAEQLVGANILHEKEDIFYLTLEELGEVIRTHKLYNDVISRRKEEYKLFEKLTPPRVITSDGEIITGKYKRENLPDKALIGLPVSAGMIEGRARVILDIEDAVLEDGDILVTTFTDPSWTPLFVSVKGLVTEVGGLMTHGAVIAREYGLPAVVGVENATTLIKDGQRIRVNGTDGYVEIL